MLNKEMSSVLSLLLPEIALLTNGNKLFVLARDGIGKREFSKTFLGQIPHTCLCCI